MVHGTMIKMGEAVGKSQHVWGSEKRRKRCEGKEN